MEMCFHSWLEEQHKPAIFGVTDGLYIHIILLHKDGCDTFITLKLDQDNRVVRKLQFQNNYRLKNAK